MQEQGKRSQVEKIEKKVRMGMAFLRRGVCNCSLGKDGPGGASCSRKLDISKERNPQKKKRGRALKCRKGHFGEKRTLSGSPRRNLRLSPEERKEELHCEREESSAVI